MKNKFINPVLIFTVIATLAVLAFYVRIRVNPDSVAVLRIPCMAGESCVDKISEGLEQQKGVVSIEVNVDAGKFIVWYDSHAVRPETLAGKLADVGYGGSAFVVLPVERYEALTGRTGGSSVSTERNCGSSCCAKKGK
jgi:copper chaperone CopZ